MRKSRFSESQIVAILKEGESGLAVAEVCRKHGISAATYYAWKSKYAGASVSDLTRMRERHGTVWGLGETGAAGPTGNRYGDPPDNAYG